MSRMIQIRNVPDALLHRGLKARAAMAGMSLSDYLLAELVTRDAQLASASAGHTATVEVF